MINKFNNSKESDTYDIPGLLLLSYPSLESFVVSNFQQDSFNLEFKLGSELKVYAHENNCNHQKPSRIVLFLPDGKAE